jgi:pSer/pThr/pTyr-binding forkhead associated (FHA) protein
VELSARTDAYAPLAGGRVWGRLVQLAKDGSDGQVHSISAEQLDIGSHEGAVILKEDPYVSPRHARLSREGGKWYAVDLASTNGIYLKVQGKRALADGDLILLGQQVLRFEVVMEAEQALRPALQHGVALFGTPQAPRFARLCQRTVEGVTRDVYHVYRSEVSMGRETADIVFGDDPFLSRRHAVLRVHGGDGARSFSLEDAGSSNGTFVAIRGRERLVGGEVLRIGLHLFRVELTSNEQGGLS